MLYHYFGIVFGRVKRVVALVSASLGEAGAHAAVWSGCNADGNTSWVQGGIFLDDINASVPSAYIEQKGPDVPDGYSLLSWPMSKYGIKVTVVLKRNPLHSRQWRVVITYTDEGVAHKFQSQWVKVPHPTFDADLELLGPSQAVCTINGKQVTGTSKK